MPHAGSRMRQTTARRCNEQLAKRRPHKVVNDGHAAIGRNALPRAHWGGQAVGKGKKRSAASAHDLLEHCYK
jgi:hypothetical protein